MKALLITLCLALAVTLAGAAPVGDVKTAAAIEYQVLPRPADLPADFQAAPGSSLQFLAIKALDGFRVDAALFQPEGKPAADTALVILVHGSGDNYYHAPDSFLARGLAAKGYAALTISTRQHDQLVNTDNFFAVRRDLEAAVATARALGYRRLVLSGHSLGNIQVQFFAANNWEPDIKAVLLLGPFGNLPWKSRNILVQNPENFSALDAAARKNLRDGKPDEIMPVKMRTFTGQEVPISAQHFLTYRLEQTSAADGTYWIRRIPYPILIVRDQADGVILPFEPYMLLNAALADGSLAPSIKYVLLPNSKPTSLQNHYFVENVQPLIDTVSAWLAEQLR
jgi:dienelactone hydrolase